MVPLLWRVFAVNAAVLAAGIALLVLTPATVSFPVELVELVLVGLGFAAMLAVDWILLRRLLGRLQLERDAARRVLAAQEGERERIGRELHDEVGQSLTAIMLQLDRLHRQTPVAELAEAREGVRASLDEVRALSRRLRPEALDDLGLPAALANLAADVSRRTGVRVERDITPGPRLASEEELVVYRVAQEALTNAVRHGDTTNATLRLDAVDGGVVLEVSDDGAGFDRATVGTGSGLEGMHERARLIGASLDIASAPGEGTTVRLRVVRP